MLAPGTSWGQRIDFPDPPPITAPDLVPSPQGAGAAPFIAQPPGATLGASIQPFDPYAAPNPGQTFWPGPYGASPPGALPVAMPPGVGPMTPAPGQPQSPWLPPAYGEPTPYDVTSPYGGQLPGAEDSAASASGNPFERLFQDTGFRYAWLYGSDGRDLQLNEIEASTTAYCPNFLHSSSGLRVTPGFALTLTDGPTSPDLPPQLYGAYLNFGWEPQFGPRFGAEVTFRTGVYSDFQAFSSQSIRFIGTGLGAYRMTANSSLKLGVAYIDRNKIKLLPVIGLLWEPNSQTRWDILFPAPKLANYWTTVGNKQVWWYLGGEYGGGSWTIKREGEPLIGTSDRIDINDIRVYLGVESWNLSRLYAFLEVGYVFQRQIVYVTVPSDTTDVSDTFMLRAGVSF